jgi:hypothetical protein
MLLVYSKIPNDEIRKSAKKAIYDIAAWFDRHPKRRVCRVEVWYGKSITVKRATVKEQINEAAKKAMK